MAAESNIEWTDATWNPIVGCSIVSPGCKGCYAMKMAARINRMNPGNHYHGTVKTVNGKPVWTGKLALAPENILTAPLRWKKPRKIFVNSMGDLFHEDAPDAWIDQVFAVMALAPQHTFQVLTKRSKRMRDYFAYSRATNIARLCIDRALGGKLTSTQINSHWPVISHGDVDMPSDVSLRQWPLPNVWLGVSAEDQTRADERIPHLLATPAAVRFVSAEPLLGPINFGKITVESKGWQDVLVGWRDCEEYPGIEEVLNWIIVGGESGDGARPMKPEWAEAIKAQCQAAGVAFFMKQMGGPVKARMPAIPPSLMVREFPEIRHDR